MQQINKYVFQNISHQAFQSVIFFVLVFVVSICLFSTGFLTENMQSGVEQSGGQIAADIVIVPSDYSEDAKSSLFAGEACTMLMDENLTDQVGGTAGVKYVSDQLYLETLSLDCCSAGGIQVIAIDPKTDFTVGKWLVKNDIDELRDNKVFAGSSSGLKENDTVELYGQRFEVAEVLAETGMGYDASLFVAKDIADKITSNPEYKEIFNENTGLASMILVKADSETDIETVRKNISDQLRKNKISVYATDSLIQGLNKQLSYFQTFGLVINSFVIVLATVSLFALETIIFYRRKNRIGSFLSVGISRKKIIQMYFTEYFYLMAAATAAGIILVCIFLFPLYDVIKSALDIPYKFIGINNTLFLALKTLIINFVIMIVSLSLSFFRILKYEPAILSEEQ